MLTMGALTLLMFGDILFVSNPPFVSHGSADLMLQFVPWRQFGFDELRQGNLALWNPHTFSGTPFFGSFQSALLYPPNWLFLILPIRHAVNWSVALHVFLAGWFTALWCLRYGIRMPGAILAGVMFAFGMPYFLHIYAGHLPFLSVAAWSPMVFLVLDEMRRRERVGLLPVAGAAVVALQIVAGYPQPAYYTAFAGGLYQLLLSFRAPRRWTIAAGFVTMYVLGAAIAAIQLLPGLEVARESVRAAGTTFEYATLFSLPPANALTLLTPHVLGDMSQAAPYFGEWFLWEVSMYVGLIGLILAVIGAVHARGPIRAVAIVLALFLLVLALGNHTPLFGVFHRYFPGFNNFRAPARFIFLAVLFVSLLAGLGWSRCVDGGLKLGRWAIGCAVAAVLVGAFALTVWSRRTDPGTPWARAIDEIRQGSTQLPPAAKTDPLWIERSTTVLASQLTIPALVLLIVAGALFASRTHRKALYVLPVLAGLEILTFARSDRATFPSMPDWPVSWAREAAMTQDDRALVLGPLSNHGMLHGVKSIWGYDPVVLRRYAEFMAASQGFDPDRAMDSVAFKQLANALATVRLKAVFQNDLLPQVVRADPPLPRLLILHDAIVRSDRDGVFAAMAGPDFDPRQTVILESAPVPGPTRASGPESARVVRETTDTIEIEAELSQPGVLLVTDSYSAGWRARSVGDSAQSRYDVLPANYVLRAVPLAAGRHHLLLEYSPWGYRAGMWISVVALVVCFGITATRRWRTVAPRALTSTRM